MNINKLIKFSEQAKDFSAITGLDVVKLTMNHSLTEKDIIPFEELFTYTSSIYSDYQNMLAQYNEQINTIIDEEKDSYSNVKAYCDKAISLRQSYVEQLINSCVAYKNKYLRSRNGRIVSYLEVIHKNLEKFLNDTDNKAKFTLPIIARVPDTQFKTSTNILSYLRAFEQHYSLVKNSISGIPNATFKELLVELDIVNTFSYLENKL